MEEETYLNRYRCPGDGTLWVMIWSCMCNDRCPTCNSEITPYDSEALAGVRRSQSQAQG